MELPLDDEWGLQLFETFDHSQDGTLDYKEFVAGNTPLIAAANRALVRLF